MPPGWRRRTIGGMTTPTPSPTLARPRRRARLAVATATAALLLGACGTSGGSDGADGNPTTTKADASTTTEAPTTTAASTEEAGDDPAAAPGVMTPVFGEVLFETDFSDPSIGGVPESDAWTFSASGLQIDVPDATTLNVTPGDEKFADGILVTSSFDLVNMEVAPDLTVGVSCRSSSAGSYKGFVRASDSDPGTYHWGIYKDVEGAEPELLLDSDEPVEVAGAYVPVGLVCLRTTAGEQLQILVGDQAPGVVVDTGELLNGSYVSAVVETPPAGSTTTVASLSVTRVTGET